MIIGRGGIQIEIKSAITSLLLPPDAQNMRIRLMPAHGGVRPATPKTIQPAGNNAAFNNSLTNLLTLRSI
jgi:hypothetical protein